MGLCDRADAIALDAPPGPVEIHASAGRTFVRLALDVYGILNVMKQAVPLLYDYGDHIEFGGRETDGARGASWPTDAEVLRCCPWADRISAPAETITLAELATLGRAVAERFELYYMLALASRCPFCSCALRNLMPSGQPEGHRLTLEVCERCGWWRGEDFVDSTGEWMICRERAAVLKRFSLDSPDAPLELIREHLSKRPDDSRWLHPKRLEDLVGHVFSDFYDTDVVHVGGRGDGGIDLFVLDGEQRRAVQVKRRHIQHPEGVAFVREFVGALLLRGDVHGVFVTTAPRFTRAAVEAAETAVQRRLVQRLELIANPDFTAMCARTTTTKAPWEDAVVEMYAADAHQAAPGPLSPTAQAAASWYNAGADPRRAAAFAGLVSDAPG